MRRRPPECIELSRAQHTALSELVRDGRIEQRVARRARILLAMSDPRTMVNELAAQVAYTPTGVWYVCRRFEALGLDAIVDAPRTGRPRELSAVERVQIEQLACCDPLGLGLELTHWSTRSLAAIAAERLQRPHLAHSTVSLILREADLQPHRSRYWKTPTLNAEFVMRASRILWCYERVAHLQAHDEIVIGLDEKPNLQALERAQPTLPLRTGLIERQAFEYIRHGTVNFIVVVTIYDGKVQGWCLQANDSENLIPILQDICKRYRQARRLHLIWDNGSSHISHETAAVLHSYQPWLRVLFTPARSSWLNQSELILRGLSQRYLKRGSWTSQQALSDHLLRSCDEYNRYFARPVQWTWTRRQMHEWVDKHTVGLS
jgi:transposase